MSSWASNYIKELQEGKTVQFRPFGHSMKGKIKSGQLVTVKPFDSYLVGDIVLCGVRGRDFLHLIKGKKDNSYLIGNNIGGINGWTTKIYGKVIC